jgi:sec-independent protein translocase protein TatA
MAYQERSLKMPHLGPLELGIILVIVLLLFGVGRIGKIAGELGTGVRSFREGLKSDEKDKEKEPVEDSTKTTKTE